MCDCKKNDKYQVCPHPPSFPANQGWGHFTSKLFSTIFCDLLKHREPRKYSKTIFNSLHDENPGLCLYPVGCSWNQPCGWSEGQSCGWSWGPSLGLGMGSVMGSFNISHRSNQMSWGSQISKLTLCVKFLKRLHHHHQSLTHHLEGGL